jgi:hypothetical protein
LNQSLGCLRQKSIRKNSFFISPIPSPKAKELHGFDQVAGRGGDGVEHAIGRRAFARRVVDFQAVQNFLEQVPRCFQWNGERT